MVKRKSAKEVLAAYSSQQLTEILIEELKAVGITYTVDPTGHASQFIPLSPVIPLSPEDTIQEEEKSEIAFSFSLELFGAKKSYSYTAPTKQKVQMKKSYSKESDGLQSKLIIGSNSIVAA